jgi:hypothetical protein
MPSSAYPGSKKHIRPRLLMKRSDAKASKSLKLGFTQNIWIWCIESFATEFCLFYSLFSVGLLLEWVANNFFFFLANVGYLLCRPVYTKISKNREGLVVSIITN